MDQHSEQLIELAVNLEATLHALGCHQRTAEKLRVYKAATHCRKARQPCADAIEELAAKIGHEVLHRVEQS